MSHLPPSRDKIVDSPRLDLVVQWLRQFPDSAHTVQLCCRRLFDEGSRAEVHMQSIACDHGALEGTLTGLERHLMDPAVCTWACAALAVILRESRHFQKHAGPRALPLALEALVLHPRSPDGCRFALAALLLLVIKCACSCGSLLLGAWPRDCLPSTTLGER